MKRSQNNTYRSSMDVYEDETLVAENNILKKRRSSYLRLLGIVTVMAMALIMLYVAARLFFVVDTIEITGNERYSAEQIKEKCGIKEGEFMFGFASSDVEGGICRSLPYIEKVTLHREYPSTVKVVVEEVQVSCITFVLNKYIAFSAELKVLEVCDENKWGEDAILFELPHIIRAIEGYEIEFSDTQKTDYIKDFIDALSEFDGEYRINSADLTDSFSIKMVFGDTYDVLFGKSDELNVKMRTLSRIMKSDRFDEVKAASIDMTDPKEPSFVPIETE